MIDTMTRIVRVMRAGGHKPVRIYLAPNQHRTFIAETETLLGCDLPFVFQRQFMGIPITTMVGAQARIISAEGKAWAIAEQ